MSRDIELVRGVERERHDLRTARRDLEVAIAQRDAAIAMLLKKDVTAAVIADALRQVDGGALVKWIATLDYETAERLSVLCAERAAVAMRSEGTLPAEAVR